MFRTAVNTAKCGRQGVQMLAAARGLHATAASKYFGPCKTTEKTFDKILIANRGEIACRVIRTAKKMGIKTVAVYSDADANSLHVRLADEAYNVGPAPSSQSYLNVDVIMKAIKETGAQAVHPGYGFLSENASFVKLLEAENVAFIGPDGYAMGAMGDKIQSKIIAKEAGVNVIPGFNGIVEDAEHAVRVAEEIGYPVMVKASAGGGGKGMRVARTPEQVRESFKLCRDEAQSSFGDSRLLVERYIDEPHHIEIQVLADKLGNVVYLPERECSIQRRNQKVIEEAPSTHMNEATRRAMGEQAVALAKNVGYTSAGTVEFLVDSERNFFFLEMNTRLQVEHPITEYITKLDLVEQMIRAAAGLPLGVKQEDVKLEGHAIESRVYAEDPEKYLPSIGTLSRYVEPESWKLENDVRCDSGITEGSEISMYYDPMICKLSTFGKTRNDCIATMNHALDRYLIKGVTHNIPLLRDVIGSKAFARGNTSTWFLPINYPNGFKGHRLNEKTLPELALAAMLVHVIRGVRSSARAAVVPAPAKPFELVSVINIRQDDDTVERVLVPITAMPKSDLNMNGKTTFQVTVNVPNKEAVKSEVTIDWAAETPFVDLEFAAHQGEANIATMQFLDPTPLGVRMQFMGTKFDVDVLTKPQLDTMKYMKEPEKIDTSKYVLAPMPGTVVSISVKVGDIVAEGAEVAVIEAMKMQNVLRAPRVGTVKKIHNAAGSTVNGEDILVEFEEEVKPEKPAKK